VPRDKQTGVERTKRLIAQVRRDADDMDEFLRKKADSSARRYAQHDDRLAGAGPWRGASESWLPLSDIEIGKLKPALHAAVFGRPRVVTMLPMSADGVEHKADAEMVMESLLRGRGTNSMPDFEEQHAYIEDEAAEGGYGVVKVYWEARSRPGPETVRRDRLPGVLGKLVIKPGMSEEERARVQQQQPGINGQPDAEGRVRDPDFEAVFGTSDINPVNRRVWGEIEDAVKLRVIDLFDLDPNDELDAKACDDIMAWLAGGTVEPKLRVKRRQVLRDAPRLVSIPKQDFIFPPGMLSDFSRADRCAQRYLWSEHELREMAQSRGWKVDIEQLMTDSRRSSHDITDELTYEQMSRMDEWQEGDVGNDIYEIWQIYAYDTEGDESVLRVRWVEPQTDTELEVEDMPYDHREIPFSLVRLEVNKPYARDSRGVPDMIHSLESHATAHLRFAENTMMWTGNPTIIAGHDVEMPGEGEWYPGCTIRGRPGDVGFLDMPRVEHGNLGLMNFYMGMAGNVVGAVETEEIQAVERRTAREADAIQGRKSLIAGYRIALWLAQLERPLNQVWALYQQYGPREHFVNITGEEPRRVTQSQIAGRYHARATAATGAADPQHLVGQASQLLQTFGQIQDAVGQSLEFETHPEGLLRYIASNIDPVLARAFIRERSPQEQQQMLQQMEAQAEFSRQLAQLAEKLEQNVGLEPAEALALIKEMQRNSPHKGLTRIKQNAAQAEMEVNRARTLTS